MSALPLPPTADAAIGRRALSALAHRRSILSALEIMHEHLGDVFQITLPGFQPVVVAGPRANRQVLVERRDSLHWRNERDPVVDLLGSGVLVLDGSRHDEVRALMTPFLRRRRVLDQAAAIVRDTDLVLDEWRDGEERDLLVELRRVALVIVIDLLFGANVHPHLPRLWAPILAALDYISPGPWVVWPGIPRPGYRRKLRELDAYLYHLIDRRRQAGGAGDDLLGRLVTTPGMDDRTVRDQMLTLLIAGHDTSTASLAWTLYLLATHPGAMERARAEVDRVLAGAPPAAPHVPELDYLALVFQEALRLYPPIHVGNRLAVDDLEIAGYHVPRGTRVMYSIYLTHRDPAYWDDPEAFRPERFAPDQRGDRPSFAYLPFGAGPRTCIGAAFAQVEAMLVLSRVLQRFDLDLVSDDVHPHMGATLEPAPGVAVRVTGRMRA